MIINQNISVIAEIFIYFRVSAADIPFTTCARNLGFMISDTMTLDKHISTVCRSAYLKIRRISSWLFKQTITLACAFVLSRLGYCHSLLPGCSLYLLSGLQKVQDSVAKLVFKARKRDHVQLLLQALQWLSVQARIGYKLSAICHNFFSVSCLFV